MKNHLYLIIILIVFSACEKKIKGKVVNNFNQPIEGVDVSISNSNFNSVTDADGEFEIDYVAGEFVISFKKPNHRSETRNLKITQKEEYPLNKIELIKYPLKDGLFLMGKEGYIELKKSTLIKTEKTEKSRYGSVSYDYFKTKTDSINTLDYNTFSGQDSLTFFDNLPRSVVLTKNNNDNILLTRTYQYSYFGGREFDLKGIIVDFSSDRISDGKRFLSIKTKNINDSSVYGFSELKNSSTPNGDTYLFEVK